MANVFVDEQSLVDVAAAIRTKNGTEEKYKPAEMPAAILAIQTGSEPIIEALAIKANGTYSAPDGIDGYNPITVSVPQEGAPTEEELTFTGSMSYRFANNGWNWFIDKYGSQIKIYKPSTLDSMFYQSSNLTDISFDIVGTGSSSSLYNMFSGCSKLKTLPKIKNFEIGNIQSLFSNCNNLREIPDTFLGECEFGSGATNGSLNSLFSNCFSLRRIPEKFIRVHDNCSSTLYWNNSFFGAVSNCTTLDELIDVPTYDVLSSGWTSNAFSNFVGYCHRLKRVTFKTQEDGTPYSTKWVSQSLPFDSYVGWAYSGYAARIYNYNSGITTDKEVQDDATYQALKNDADWWTKDVAYSRYNHDSAVETINTIPDTSAFLAERGSGTNTIKFKGAAGSKTDGGAINTLTAEEIAVAAAKGWTVSLT